MLTGDGVPVLFHDDSLKRLVGLDVLMAETPYGTVATLDAGSWFDPDFAGEPIPTLEAALALTEELGVHPNIEIKPTPGRDVDTAEAVVEVTGRCWNHGRPPPFISSFSRMSLAAAKVLRPQWPRGCIVHEIPADWPVALQALDCTSFHVNCKYLDWQAVAMVKGAGYKVAAFTVNSGTQARELIDAGVDSVITDRPHEIAGALDLGPIEGGSVEAVVNSRR
jgi:glycerophosphoryl diester phosphodiesterase